MLSLEIKQKKVWYKIIVYCLYDNNEPEFISITSNRLFSLCKKKKKNNLGQINIRSGKGQTSHRLFNDDPFTHNSLYFFFLGKSLKRIDTCINPTRFQVICAICSILILSRPELLSTVTIFVSVGCLYVCHHYARESRDCRLDKDKCWIPFGILTRCAFIGVQETVQEKMLEIRQVFNKNLVEIFVTQLAWKWFLFATGGRGNRWIFYQIYR